MVVSTKVGGIPEVLPDEMIIFAQPDADSLVSAVDSAIIKIQKNEIDPIKQHEKVSTMYSWEDVAKRTELVYEKVLKDPKLSLIERFEKYEKCGWFSGKFGVLIIAFNYMFLIFLEWILPVQDIDIAPDFDRQKFKKYCELKIND